MSRVLKMTNGSANKLRMVAQGALLLALGLPGCQRKASGDAQDPGSASADQTPVGGNLIRNSHFASSAALPWTSSFSSPADGNMHVKDGALCLTITDGGVNNWDAQVRHREMVIQNGHTYNISFKIWADKATMVRAKVGQAGPPYGEFWNQTVKLTTEPQVVRGGFIMAGPDDPGVEFAFHMGGGMMRDVQTPLTVCVDEIYLSDPKYVPSAQQQQQVVSAVRVNQVGYFPKGQKIAAVVSDSAEPLTWVLKQGGETIAEGQTQPFGPDKESGDSLHTIDFSSVDEQGQGYTLVVGKDVSPKFEISNSLYSRLKYDALQYFYHNRSGIEIKMPYANDEKWARPAGHATSDKAVACAEDAGCTYRLDVSKGWYDAGDHGKYVVNGGISVWTLMNQFERFTAKGDIAPFEDGKLNIPEAGNKVPDLLDEVRWQMEFMLGMQVPEGQPKAGMVHHKMHDVEWTNIGLPPHEAEKSMERRLRPVSTAATLNLAASAAQAARVFLPYDAAFAAHCLKAAEAAWKAAQKHPKIYADPNDHSHGGGPYSDDDLEDEFYWAAAELFISTKKPVYSQFLRTSKFDKTMTRDADGVPTSMTWRNTDALGTISLALSGVPDSKAQQQKIIATADSFLALIDKQGYRFPFRAGDDGKYPWGSNSFVINNLMILGYAHDFTGKVEYLEAMILGMDYLLGRNALGQSYVSGYGERPLLNPHHRFWAHQYDPKFPPAPPGALSGGPNSSLQDPYAQAAGLSGCVPQKCFIDHIEAWSVNEITINWNAPFAWVTAYLDEKAGRMKGK